MVNIISPQTGTDFTIQKGQYLKILCPEGEQVADLVAYKLGDISEFISNGKTLDYEESIFLSTGNKIYSNKSTMMLEIVEDTCGKHDFLLAPCCSQTFKKIYGFTDKHPSCMENLHMHLSKYGILEASIPTAFNIFMNVEFDRSGSLRVLPPTAEAGDFILFRAEMDLIVALTACSAKDSNGGSFKPIAYEIFD